MFVPTVEVFYGTWYVVQLEGGGSQVTCTIEELEMVLDSLSEGGLESSFRVVRYCKCHAARLVTPGHISKWTSPCPTADEVDSEIYRKFGYSRISDRWNLRYMTAIDPDQRPDFLGAFETGGS